MLAQGYKARRHGPGRPFSRFPRIGLGKVGHLPPQVKIHQIQRLGTQIYACGPSMDHFKVPSSQLAFDDVIIAEYPTFARQTAGADIHLFVSSETSHSTTRSS